MKGRTKGAKPLLTADANARLRRTHALELRVAGMNQAQIAERVGVTQPQVSRMIRKALSERESAAVEDLRAVEAERVDALHAAFWPIATERGDVGAANVILKASDRRSKLLGLDQGDGEGATVRHEYHAWAIICMSGEASEELERWEADRAQFTAWQQRSDALLPARVLVDETVPLPSGATYEDAQAVVTAALSRAVGPRSPDAPRLMIRLYIAGRAYKPAVNGRGEPQGVND